MMLTDNPFLDLVGQTADMVAQEAEKKRQLAMLRRQQMLAWQQKLMEAKRKEESERRKGILSYLLSAYKNEELTPESRTKAFDLGLKMLSQGDVDVSGFTPAFKTPEKQQQTYISEQVARLLQIPQGPYTPEEAAKYVRSYYDILYRQRQGKKNAGISITIGGKKVNRDFLLDRLKTYRKEMESILRGNVKLKDEVSGELTPAGLEPAQAAEYLKMLDELIFAIESGKLTKEQQRLILEEVVSPYLHLLSQDELEELDNNLNALDAEMQDVLKRIGHK